jgi:DHA1 family tetracycline resistance protein-like MFS transporter
MKPTKKILYLFTFFLTINFINNTILIPILTPLFIRPEYDFFSLEVSFKTRAFLLGLTLACYPAAVFIGSPIFGKLCDCIGRKKMLSIITLSTAFGNIITAIGIDSKNIYLIIIGRLICGITGGSSTPIKAIISDISDVTNRNKNFSYVSYGLALSNIFGPLLGSELSNNELLSWFNFSTPLFILSVLGLINLPLILRYIKETLHEKAPIKWDLKSPITQIKEIASIKELRVIMLVLLLYSVGYKIFSETFQTYLIDEFDINSRQIGFIFSYMGIVSFLAQLLIYNPIAKYLQREKAISYALIVYAFSMIIIISLNHFFAIYFALIITLTARSFIQTLLISCVSSIGTSNHQGKFHGYHRSVQALGELSGPLLGGIMVGYFIWAPLALSSVCMLLAYLVIKKIKKQTLT